MAALFIFSAPAFAQTSIWGATDTAPAADTDRVPVDTSSGSSPGYLELQDISPAQIFVCDETDQTAAISALMVDGANLLFKGTCVTGAIAKTGIGPITIDFAEGAELNPSAELDVLWKFTASDVRIKNMVIDGLNDAQTGIYFDGNSEVHTLDVENLVTQNIGWDVSAATATSVGLWIQSYAAGSSLRVGEFIASGYANVGNGSCGDAAGGSRGIYLLSNSAPLDVGYFEMSGGTAHEDYDYFQSNTGNAGGVIHNFVARYNENVRRVAKFQSGNWVIKNVDIRKGSDFDAFSGSTDVGLYNLNTIDWAGATAGSLVVDGGYIDCSGFSSCIGNSAAGTASVRTGPGLIVQGAVLSKTRDATDCNGALAGTYQPVFYAGSSSIGSGMDGTTILNGGTAAALSGEGSFARNVRFVDPVSAVATLSDTGALDGIVFQDNEIITQTAGYLASVAPVTIANATNFKVGGNRLIQDGNTTHNATFINVSNAGATGKFWNNIAPTATAVIGNSGAATVYGWQIDPTGAIIPSTSDVGALGSTTKMVADAFLADGGVINFNNGAGTITYNNASSADGIDINSAVLRIKGGVVSGSSSFGNQIGPNSPTNMQVLGTSAQTGSIGMEVASTTDSVAAALRFLKSGNASIGGATVLASGELLGEMLWYGTQQTGTFATQTEAASIKAFVDGTVTDGASADMPGRIEFYTSPDGSGTGTKRLTINAAGNVELTGTMSNTNTASMGFSVVTGANTACTTTCTSAAVVGFDTGTLGVSLPHMVGTADASADECLCAGGS